MLYFIGLVPPPPLQTEIQKMKMDFKNNYASSHSLNAPPHLTLISPFRKKNDLFSTDLLQDFANQHSAFEIELQNFSNFNKKVIFIDVVKNKALIDLQQNLEKMIRSNSSVFEYASTPRPYQPHLTLAFRDLNKENFYRAWEVYKSRSFTARFYAEELVLLRHYQKKWEIETIYRLGKD